ncbi:MAG TPA: biotin/lipoyl-containing protein [Vicinamibacterales bacterium]|nr:biotin/lipoyl-containing protein [Vicinamibacterales bacterium]
MTFEVELNGRTRSVSIERAGSHDRFRVTVDGVATLVDAQRNGDFGLSLLFPDGAHAGARVALAPGSAPGELLAYLRGRSAAVVVNGRRTGRGGAESGGGAQGEQKIVAPMPGRVVRVLVAPGDEVQVRQPVVVVEAMKMENELRSPKTGRVKDVAVPAGASVEAGRVLMVIE